MRTHLLALAAAGLIAAGAGVLAPAAAWADSASTVVTVTTDSTFYTAGQTVTAHIRMHRSNGTAMDGTWSVKTVEPGPSYSTILAGQPASGPTIDTFVNIPAAAAGDYVVYADFKPNNATQQGAGTGQANFSVRIGGVSLTETHGALTAGSGGSLAALISLPSGSQPVGGTVTSSWMRRPTPRRAPRRGPRRRPPAAR
jgi:hypothetical protein